MPFEPVSFTEPLKLLPVFATNLSRDPEEPGVDGWDVVDAKVAADLSPVFEEEAAALFAARKVLLTDTDLKLEGFLTDEERTLPLSSLSFEISVFDASVSDPPLTLTSAELTSSSTMSAICLFSMSSSEPFSCPLTVSTCWVVVSITGAVICCANFLCQRLQ